MRTLHPLLTTAKSIPFPVNASPRFPSMASGFVAGTTQNIIGGAVGGAVGSSGGTYLEKHTIAGLSNGAADYRSKGVLLFETYGSKLTITEFDDIRECLAEGEAALEDPGHDHWFPFYRWTAARTAKTRNRKAFRLVRKLSEKARVDDPNLQPKSGDGAQPISTSLPTSATRSQISGPMVSATAETVSDPFRDPSRFSVLPIRAMPEETDDPTWMLVSPDRKQTVRFLLPENIDVEKDVAFIYCDHPPVSDDDIQDVPSSPTPGSFGDDASAPMGSSIRLTTMSN